MIYDEIFNPVTRKRNEADRDRLRLLFPDLATCTDLFYLSLRPYINTYPNCFYSQDSYQLMRAWLTTNYIQRKSQLLSYFTEAEQDISQAFLFLRQVNSASWHDSKLSLQNDYELLHYIDQNLHPVYLRLIEGVFIHLIRPIAYFSRIDRNKNTEGLDLYNCVAELLNTSFSPCTIPYSDVVRNGISHGGITYLLNAIRYRDKRGNEIVYDTSSFIRLCDDLLDICNGLAAALKIFFLQSHSNGFNPPTALLVEELIQETNSPWWRIDGCIESEVGNKKQLIIYAMPRTRDQNTILYSALQSAILVEYLVPHYDRYYFNLMSAKLPTGWIDFNGEIIRQLRQAKIDNITGYLPALEKDGIFLYKSIKLPRFFRQISTFIHAFRVLWPIELARLKEKLAIPNIISRQANIHRNGWWSILNGAVIMDNTTNETAASIIRVNKRRIVRKVLKKARSTMDIYSPVRFLPLGYARISVYNKDFRIRRLSSFGLEKELICTIQLRYIPKITSPDIKNSSVEVTGFWRIAWNRKWQEAGGVIE